jgi:uncharacterized protein
MRVAVAGSTGFIGQTLVPYLQGRGHEVLRLVRHPSDHPETISYDPDTRQVDLDRLSGVDAVVNLAGAGIGDRRWTEAYKQTLYDSHVSTADTLARAVAAVSPRPSVLVSVGAMGYYGNDTGGLPLTEDMPAGTDFAAAIIADKEAATAPAAAAGVRVVLPRLSLVMGSQGGTLGRRLLPLAKLGLLGPLAGGATVWSIVSVTDAARALEFLLTHDDMSGPYNVSAPEATTNGEFTRLLGRAVRRPTLIPVPRFGIRIVLGELANDVLADFDVDPGRIIAAGFTFEHPDASSVIDAAVD